MSARVRYCRAEKGTVNLSKMRDGRLSVERSPGGFTLTVEEDDGRRFTLQIATREAAQEILSGVVLGFPGLV